MKSILFLGSKAIGYECLRYLLTERVRLQCEVVGVLTAANNALDHPTHNMEQLCWQQQIPIYPDVDTMLGFPPVDFIISVQYHKILRPKHIAKALQLAVNLHMAPLPELRGCNQFSFAIAQQYRNFGTTLHRLETSVDGGAILFERRFPIPDNCWVYDLYQLTLKHSVELFQAHIGDILEGNYTLTPQESLHAARGTAYHHREDIESLKKIDLNWDKEKIERHIRATFFPPFEPPYCIIEGKKFYFNA